MLTPELLHRSTNVRPISPRLMIYSPFKSEVEL
jgi:hypothetical protein